jgi:hypothetical protein
LHLQLFSSAWLKRFILLQVSARGSKISMASAEQQFDFIVIGCGSGGSACADRALQYGAKVCLIERGYNQKQRSH